MKKTLTRLIAVLLCALLLFQNGESIVAYALEDPTQRIAISVPEELQDGHSYFFIREQVHSISEKSGDKLYIPIQRTGDLSGEAEVTLKLIDVTSRHGVNYEEKIYREKPASEIEVGDVSILDLALSAEYQEEFEPLDEEELVQTVSELGGDFVDAEGNVVGELTVEDDGESAEEAEEASENLTEKAQKTEETRSLEADQNAEESEWSEQAESPTEALRRARDEYTGTVSDRQEMANSNDLLLGEKEEELPEESELVEDAYPGKTYRLHFDAGEQAKFLVVTPKYSEAADGDCQLMLMLKDPGGMELIPQNYQMSGVLITDEDEPETVQIGLAEDVIYAADGKALITVTRQGRINDIVGVHVYSWGGTGVMGEDYGGVGADLYFPMGITSRTIELPVGHGQAAKDFYVTLSKLTDAEFTNETAHVIIPPAGRDDAVQSAELMEDNNIRLGSKINLKKARGYKIGTYFQWKDDGYAFESETPDDEEDSWAGWQWVLTPGYYYDGFLIKYDYYLNWCDGQVDFNTFSDEQGTRTYSFKDTDGGFHGGRSQYWYYAETKTPYAARANIKNYNNDGWAWTDDYATLYVNSVEPIIRRFSIKVTNSVMSDGSAPHFEGVDPNTTKNYVAVQLNDKDEDNCTIWGGENFSVSQPEGLKYAKLVAVDAVKSDGTTYRLATNDGTSQTLVVTLDEKTVNALGERGFFSWSRGPGGPNRDSNSKMGNLTVRPVFDYIDVNVQVRENQYGELYTSSAVAPTILWDFDADDTMNACMGRYSNNDVSWKGEKDAAGNDYYTFTATGGDPYVSIDLSAADASDVAWAKVRARNLCGADAIELFGHTGGRALSGPECTHVDLEKDSAWHTYIINIPQENIRTANSVKGADLSETAWQGRVDWIRLDPMWKQGDGGMQDGDSIQIDYVAFFPSEETARAFRDEESSGETRLMPGTYRFHLGDVLSFQTRLTPTGELAGLSPDGFRFDLFTERNGELIDNASKAYINGVGTMKLRGMSEDETKTGDYYRIEPTFTHTENQVVVQIEESDLQYFDTASDLFATADKWLDGTTWNYRIAAKVRTNELFELWATPLDKNHIPLWRSSQDSGVYSGNAFYFMTGVYASDNIVTLSVDRDTANHAYYSLSGTAYSQVMNLSTGRATDVLVPAKETLVTAGNVSAITDDDGDFTLPTLLLAGGTTLRYTVTYNGSVNIREAKLPPTGVRKQAAPYNDPATNQTVTVQAIPISLNMVTVDSYSLTGAHFQKVEVEQDGFLGGLINAVEMNGQKVVFTVHAVPGDEYIYNNEAFVEHIQDVNLFFQNQTTKEVHGSYSIHDEYDPQRKGKLTWDPETLTATLTFEMFKPDNPGEYDAGDVLMLQLTTDKKVGLNAWAGQDMVYDPVATGIAVITDLDYEPQSFEYETPSIASLFQVIGPGEDGTGTGNSASFGRFPFLGEVKAGLKIATVLVNRLIASRATRQILTDLKAVAAEDDDWDYGEDYDDDDEDADAGGYDSADDGLGGGDGEGVVPKGSWSLSVAFTVESTHYGGIRFMFAVVGTYKKGNPYRNQVNPYKDANTAWEFFTNGRYAQNVNIDRNDLIYNSAFDSKGDELRSMYGGAHFTLGLYAGIYFDFGYICVDGQTKSSSMAIMGVGGFIGGTATLGYTWYTTIFGVPVYVNPEASLDLHAFVGGSFDPDKTLESFKSTKSILGTDFGLSLQFTGKLTAGLTLGVGIYKVLGVRVSAILGFEAGAGNKMAEWYPEINSNWGFTTDITFKGTIDLAITSIDLVDYSWPLPWNGGWMACLQEVRRAKTLIKFVDSGIAKGEGTAAARARCSELADELKATISDRETLVTSAVTGKIAALKEYAYKNDIISWTQKNRVEMNRQGGVIGGIIEENDFEEGVIGLLQSDEGETSSGARFHTRDHVQSKWTAGKRTKAASSLQSVYTAVLEEDAYAQTSSQIMAIGDNKYLMVFLEDDPARDRQQAGKLAYTIYDANRDTWTAPETVQDDDTADGRPCLVDAGDKIILTWSSIAQSKFTALKNEVAQELTALNEGRAPDAEEIVMELEDDPTRVLMQMDVFVTEFDKEAKSFSPIEQLTDDDYYDDAPQAVYDSKTGDYIVMYYKTAQDDAAYTDESAQLIDLVGGGPAPDKTYSMLCYMLYNNQTDAKDTQGRTHAPGWARDYLFPNETEQDLAGQTSFLQSWGGQRFLPASISGMSDPPISDLTVCEGYNDLAAYAFTVDKDYDLSTGEDKELYLQFYRFSEHSTYVPVKVAGEQTEGEVTAAVDVGAPKLIRNGGSTWLFWRENGDSLKYLNVSDLLKDKVATSPDPGTDDWTWAVREDGAFAVDAMTGQTYAPDVQTVDFGSLMTKEEFTATDYQVITDRDDNLYVVWSDTVLFDAVDPETGETYEKTAQEIFASAMIREDLESAGTATDINTEQPIENTGANSCVNWSKPYRLTRENNFNDGIAIALDDDGGLIILHNQYEEVLASSKDEVQTLLETGQVGVKEMDGKLYILGSLLYDSPYRLMVTRCASVSSLEATAFSFSHNHPIPGETVKVCAAIENVGLTAANGCEIEFYEYRNGVRGRRIASYDSDELIQVNTARTVEFLWTIPKQGVNGCYIQAYIFEKKPDGTVYAPTESFSETFTTEPAYQISLDSFTQNGDVFDVKYTVTNIGNRAAVYGTKANLCLDGLYGDLQELYGVESDLLFSEDISGLEPRETRTVTTSVSIPVSVFRFCGYDAVQAAVVDQAGTVIEETGQRLVKMDAPMNLQLNGGKALTLAPDETRTVSASFDTTAFLASDEVIYSVDDPSVASVDADGNVTALDVGKTTLTATLLPSGRSTSVRLVVGEGCKKDESCPISAFTDAQPSAWYHDGVHWALEEGVMNGVGSDKFAPDSSTSRAMIVTMLWRMEGEPESGRTVTFQDVPAGQWYTDAIRWAAEKGIVKGYSADKFGPDDRLAREQLVTILERYAEYRGVDVSAGENAFLTGYTDADTISDWAVKAFRWAVNAGIINGVTQTTLSPKTNATRAQVATMLMRYSSSDLPKKASAPDRRRMMTK